MANQATKSAGLTFNVESVKKDLKQYYETHFEKHGEQKEGDNKVLVVPQFTGGQIAMSAFLQKLYELVLQECLRCVPKDKSGVRHVTLENLQYTILLNKGLEQYFLTSLKYYDTNQIYEHGCPVVRSEMDEVRDSVSKELAFSNQAHNMVCYLLTKAFTDVAHDCHYMIEYAKKRTFSGRCVLFAVSAKFHESIAVELRSAIMTACKSADYDLEDKQEQQEGQEGENKEEQEAETQTKDTKKQPKKDAKVDTKTETKQKDVKHEDKPAKNQKKNQKETQKATTLDVDDDNGDEANDDSGNDALDDVPEVKETKTQKQPQKKEQQKEQSKNTKPATKK